MAKMELSKVPLFNIWFKTIDVPVKRESLRNAHTAFVKAAEKLDEGASLIIFPEGKIPDEAPVMNYPLKPGAFKLAVEKGIPVVPISILDNFERFNIFTFFMSPGRMRMIVHEPIETKNLTEADVKELSENVFNIINKELLVNKIV
jgi:1-acyl-sn-glycerol-3-phosphate acyltransferase